RAFGNKHSDLNAAERNRVSWFHDRALVAGNSLILFQSFPIGLFDSVAMIVKMQDWDHFRQCDKAAFMIRMPVTDHHMIDLPQTGLLRRSINPFCVAIAIPRKSRIE